MEDQSTTEWSQVQEIVGKDEYYLVTIRLDGSINIKTAVLKKIGQSETGITKPEIVLADGKKGFLKDSRLFDEGDDLECLINAIGRFLGIPMAEEYRVYNQQREKDSLLSMDVSENGRSEFYELNRVWKIAVERFNEKNDQIVQWMTDWRRITQKRAFPDIIGSNEFLCETESDCETAIMLPIYVLSYLFSDQKDNLESFKRNYFQMIVFDLLLGQTDRTMDNYGILYSKKDGDYSFAPLFDNANLIKPMLPEYIYTLNYVAIDREKIMHILMWKYPEYVLPVMQRIEEKFLPIVSRVIETINSWIQDENKDRIIDNISGYFRMYAKEIKKPD